MKSIIAAIEALPVLVQYDFDRVTAAPFTSADYLHWLLTKNGRK